MSAKAGRGNIVAAWASSEALDFLGSQLPNAETTSLNVLGFLDRAAPKSRLLLDYCLSTLGSTKSTPHYTSDEARYAIELLGKHFAGDPNVLKELMRLTPAQAQDGNEV